jgi:spermidine synthase
MTNQKRPAVFALFLLTVFTSAFLLFQVQPLISKYILPWFGGSPAVWTTCMLFFQITLFGGYVYAHLLVARLSPKWQAITHITLLAAALAFLPISPNEAWKPADAANPALRIMILLAATVGLPYFILSATGPLLQGWFLKAVPGQSPYRLYALSNVGSLLALLTYPFIFEPGFTTQIQAQLWSGTFVIFAAICAACAVVMARRGTTAELKVISGEHDSETASGPAAEPDRPAFTQMFLWFALAAVPSTLLLATTNQVCADIASVPFLWVLPLSLYLLSFILCFDSDRWYNRQNFGISLGIFAAGSCFLLWDAALNWHSIRWIAVQAAIFFGMLFCSCMVCHGELVRLKPDPKYLTVFYLSISAGGALGGLFVGMVAPVVFDTLIELHIGIVAGCLLLLAVIYRDESSPLYRGRIPAAWATMIIGVVVLGWTLNAHAKRVTQNSISVARNFYGSLRVEGFRESYILKHGQIRHGHQFRDAEKRKLPTSYYGYESGCGLALKQHLPDKPKRVGLIGLGAGTLAIYSRPGDYYRIYEINPTVVDMAREFFTYLTDAEGQLETVIADGRIALEREEPQRFDVLVLDAFSGDAVPTHLLTKECGELYMKHLNEDGILAIHITNRHVNLMPVCNGLAKEFGLAAVSAISMKNSDMGTSEAQWVLLSRSREPLKKIDFGQTATSSLGEPAILWTDNFSNLLSVMAN